MAQEDRDLLIEIKSDTKHLVKWSDDHSKLDDKRFETQEQRTGRLERFMWVLMGGGMAIQVIISLWGKAN